MLELKIKERDYSESKYILGKSYCGLTKVESKKDGKYGYIDSYAQEVIPCIYEMATDFSEGYAIVVDIETKVINTKGEVIAVLPNSLGYQIFRTFHNGLCLVGKNGGYNYINIKGEELLPNWVRHASKFSDGLALINAGSNPQVIDTKGNVHPEILEEYNKIKNSDIGKNFLIYCSHGFNNGILPIYDEYGNVYGYICKDGRFFERTHKLDSIYNFVIPQYLIERPVDLNNEALNSYCSDITFLGEAITLVASTKEELALKKKEFYRELKDTLNNFVNLEINPQLEEEQGVMRKL